MQNCKTACAQLQRSGMLPLQQHAPEVTERLRRGVATGHAVDNRGKARLHDTMGSCVATAPTPGFGSTVEEALVKFEVESGAVRCVEDTVLQALACVIDEERSWEVDIVIGREYREGRNLKGHMMSLFKANTEEGTRMKQGDLYLFCRLMYDKEIPVSLCMSSKCNRYLLHLDRYLIDQIFLTSKLAHANSAMCINASWTMLCIECRR